MSSRRSDIGIRDRILTATVDLLSEQGIHGWTIEALAERTPCAKGLVNYHFGSKGRLLELAAERVRSHRVAGRVRALEQDGTVALNALWVVLTEEVRAGRFALWLALLGHRPTAAAASLASDSLRDLTTAAATVLAIPASNPLLGAFPAMLDGFQLLLLQDRPEEEVRELYDRWLLTLLEEV
jgi:AcrR family transcriptional regulator